MCESDIVNVKKWMQEVLHDDNFHCTCIPLSQSTQWQLTDGAIRHQSGRFFSIIGLRWTSATCTFWQPFIDQQEIGTLGFLIKRTAGDTLILVYAKVEPGNVGGVQIAPTCQATRSNLDRVHKGKSPAYCTIFESQAGTVLSSSLQSEQGTRFYKKQNLNTIIESALVEAEGRLFQWIPLSLFQHLLCADFMVNTDARSVIVTCDWQQLFQRPLFAGGDPFTQKLRKSYTAPLNRALFQDLDARKSSLCNMPESNEICPVDQLPGWNFQKNVSSIISNSSHSIIHIQVQSASREVENWDQPIFSTHYEEQETLICSIKESVLKFGFRLVREPGLIKKAELAPTVTGELPAKLKKSQILLTVRQSDEGGRFYQDITKYCIRELVDSNGDDDLIWLTLADIIHLLPLGWFTNQSRSVISLLLSQA